MKQETFLRTVPTFQFQQEEETPILVSYYNGTISLEQGSDSINIEPQMFDELVKAIKKHKNEAETWLEKNTK